MPGALKNFIKFLFFLGLGIGILYLLYQNQDKAYQAQCALDGIPSADCALSKKLIQDFSGVHLGWIFMVLLAFMVSNISRAARWNMLIRQLGAAPRYSNAFFTVMLGYFANLGLPRMGEVVRAGTMARYEKLPVEKIMGTVVVDRVIDAISLLIVIGLAFFLEFNTLSDTLSRLMGAKEGSSILFLSSLAGAGLLLVGLFWVFRKAIQQSSIYKKVYKLFLGFWEGIKTIGTLSNPTLFILHSIIIWLMYYVMTYFCFLSFHPTEGLSLVAVLMVFVFGSFGIVIPSPGGMGTYHFLVIQALALYGVGQVDAFSYANISFFSIVLGCNVFFGILALLILPFLNKNYHPGNETLHP
jgi:uncharacterized protein (TIRG00374 family)